eukprot:2953634-Pleurochrysis_carterae.AAC.1
MVWKQGLDLLCVVQDPVFNLDLEAQLRSKSVSDRRLCATEWMKRRFRGTWLNSYGRGSEQE